MQFRLSMDGILSATEFENTDLKEIEWLYGRLQKHKQMERESIKKAMHGDTYSEHVD